MGMTRLFLYAEKPESLVCNIFFKSISLQTSLEMNEICRIMHNYCINIILHTQWYKICIPINTPENLNAKRHFKAVFEETKTSSMELIFLFSYKKKIQSFLSLKTEKKVSFRAIEIYFNGQKIYKAGIWWGLHYVHGMESPVSKPWR